MSKEDLPLKRVNYNIEQKALEYGRKIAVPALRSMVNSMPRGQYALILTEAYISGAEAQRTQPYDLAALSSPASEGLRWVKCSDKMPDKEGWYCITHGEAEAKCVMFFRNGIFFNDDGYIPSTKTMKDLNYRWLSSSPAPVVNENEFAEMMFNAGRELMRNECDYLYDDFEDWKKRSGYKLKQPAPVAEEGYTSEDMTTIAKQSFEAGKSHPTPDKIREMLGEAYMLGGDDAEICKCDKQGRVESLINKYKV